ncbi:MAG: hypothetical protein Q7R54_01755 [bacterium]|nr:hypothetical protein [bacterium]
MLKLIFWIVIGVLALSFFGISLQSIINSPAGQENFAYLWQLIVATWNWFIAFIQNKISGS